ncbi:HNH endonuclease [Nocardioides sp.]|uniref:HNH endonuclease n=1 Tax=Nocardioides sp. TaxID=35761 RepID=UPI0039E63A33
MPRKNNGGDPGNAEDRRRRREWLVQTYRADVDAGPIEGLFSKRFRPVARGTGVPACRCYRCGRLLTVDTLSVDRIKPGIKGGTYRRDNIRPSCSPCATDTGNELKRQMRRAS